MSETTRPQPAEPAVTDVPVLSRLPLDEVPHPLAKLVDRLPRSDLDAQERARWLSNLIVWNQVEQGAVRAVARRRGSPVIGGAPRACEAKRAGKRPDL